MILETDVDGDAQQNESESDAATDRHGVPPEYVSTVTVEVEQPKIRTVVESREDGDFHSHERPVRPHVMPQVMRIAKSRSRTHRRCRFSGDMNQQ